MAKNRKDNQPAKLPPDTPTVVTEQSVSYSEMHVGPLPPARDLVLLEENIPGAFDRIMSFAEKVQDHQAKFTETIVETNCSCMKRSQVYGFSFAILYMAFLILLAFLGKEEPLKYAIVSGMVVGLPAVIYSFLPSLKKKPDSNGHHQ